MSSVEITAKQLVKDADIIRKIIQLRVNTWPVLGPGCCMEYHATASEFSLKNLVKLSDDLVAKATWVPSLQAREIGKITGTCVNLYVSKR